MDNDISKVREDCAFIEKLFLNNRTEIYRVIKNSKYPYTAKALKRFIRKIEILNKGLENSVLDKNFYLSQILLRTLFEHLLVSYYIWTRNRLELNDNCGQEYYMQYFIAEWFKQERFDLGVEDIENKSNVNDLFRRLIQKFPGLKELEKKQEEEINGIGNQFDLKKIGNYLVNKIPSDDPFKEMNTRMLDFLKRYNKLSSFIHAGPYSEMMTFDNLSGQKQNELTIEARDWGIMALRTCREHIMYFAASIDKRMINLIIEIILYHGSNTMPNKL